MDADVRILDIDLTNLSFQPGLTARSSYPLSKHLKQQFDKQNLSSKRHKKKLIIEKMAKYIGLPIDNPSLKFVNDNTSDSFEELRGKLSIL